MPASFLTGSRVYGQPVEDSDIDLVVRLPMRDAEKLSKFADEVCGGDNQPRYNGMESDLMVLRFGSLNIMCCGSMRQYEAWKKATELAKDRAVELGRGLEKSESVHIFENTFHNAGV